MFEESERPVNGFKKTYMTVLDIKKMSSYKFFTNFVFVNLSMDPDPDRIRIQQQAKSGPGFSEYGSETLQKPSHFFNQKAKGLFLP
jgi:hypothetical protein